MVKQLVTDKQLIPGKFGLDSKTVTPAILESTIKQQLKAMKLAPVVVEYCTELMNNSKSGKSTFKVNSFNIPEKDVRIILKDFGELTGALYMLKTTKYDKVEFPTGNEKLIDYTLVGKQGKVIRVSAKSGEGGKPSITSVMPIISQLSKSNKIQGAELKAAKVLELISTDKKNGLYFGPLDAAAYLKTPGYTALIAVLKKLKVYGSGVPTAEQLENAVNAAGSYKNVLKVFDDFFIKSGYKANINHTVMQRVLADKSKKKYGILHYPITAELVKWLSTDKNGSKSLLTKAANTLNVTQVYLDLKAELHYTVMTFSDAQFTFGSPSSVPYPTNNRIGFKMIKPPKAKNK
jgi:hypothetical protein